MGWFLVALQMAKRNFFWRTWSSSHRRQPPYVPPLSEKHLWEKWWQSEASEEFSRHSSQISQFTVVHFLMYFMLLYSITFILLTLRTFLFLFGLPYLKASYRPYLILRSKDVNWVQNGNDASNSVLSAVLFLLSGHLSAPASQNRGLNTYFSVLHPAPSLTRYQWHITQWIKCESHNEFSSFCFWVRAGICLRLFWYLLPQLKHN